MTSVIILDLSNIFQRSRGREIFSKKLTGGVNMFKNQILFFKTKSMGICLKIKYCFLKWKVPYLSSFFVLPFLLTAAEQRHFPARQENWIFWRLKMKAWSVHDLFHNYSRTFYALSISRFLFFIFKFSIFAGNRKNEIIFSYYPERLVMFNTKIKPRGVHKPFYNH